MLRYVLSVQIKLKTSFHELISNTKNIDQLRNEKMMIVVSTFVI